MKTPELLQPCEPLGNQLVEEDVHKLIAPARFRSIENEVGFRFIRQREKVFTVSRCHASRNRVTVDAWLGEQHLSGLGEHESCKTLRALGVSGGRKYGDAGWQERILSRVGKAQLARTRAAKKIDRQANREASLRDPARHRERTCRDRRKISREPLPYLPAFFQP